MGKSLSDIILKDYQPSKDKLLQTLREEAIGNFKEAGFPGTKHEEWKYTNLGPILNVDYSSEQSNSPLQATDFNKFGLNMDSYKMVFVDGLWSEELSDTKDAAFKVLPFHIALEQETELVENHLGSVAPLNKQAWIEVNTANAEQGVVVQVPARMQIEKPLEILYVNSGKIKAPFRQYRNLIILEEGAELQVYERHQSLENIDALNNVVTEVILKERSHYDHYKIQNDQANTALIDNTWLAQYSSSNATVDTFSLEGKFIRNNLSFMHRGEHIESRMYGVSLIGDNQLVDHHTLVDHAQPNCNSNQLYKGIYQGNAKGVFNGKVMVHSEAQKTNAFQQNNNVLLGDHASLDTKPQLEIFADDVKCSHGCTVGQLDEDAIFYLRSRGIGKEEAQALLLYAFCVEALEGLRIQELKAKLKRLIAKKLGVDLDFDLN